jgi:hypothetical protein
VEIIKAYDGKEYFKLQALIVNGVYKSVLIEKEDFKEAVMNVLGVTAIGDGKTNPFFKKDGGNGI